MPNHMTYEKLCQNLARGRARLAEIRKSKPTIPDETILADLLQTNPKLTYVEIAYRNKTNIVRVCKLAKASGLSRYKKESK
ncbi:MAG TPA: hypothetical protein VG844_10725 [Terracidiphilus sp.]|nr:hypothetical protein [Terracidiphilus sp.]